MHKHECDLNIQWSEGANVIMCYNICDWDCSIKINSSLFAWFESIDFDVIILNNKANNHNIIITMIHGDIF